MKKLLTKALGVVLSLAVAASCLAPATVLAAVEAPKKQTVYFTSKNKGESATAYLNLTKNVSDATLKLTANKNWKITSADVYFYEKNEYGYYDQVHYNSRSKGRSSLKINLGDLSKKESYEVHIQMTNTKDGGTLDCHYYVN